MQSEDLNVEAIRLVIRITLFALWTSACLSLATTGNYYPWLTNPTLSVIGLSAKYGFWLLIVGAVLAGSLQVISTIRAVRLYERAAGVFLLVIILSLLHICLVVIGYFYS